MFGINEFLVPRKHENFSQMLKELDPVCFNRKINKKNAVFSFMSVDFDSCSNDSRRDENEPYVHTKMKTKRLRSPHMIHDESRYILQGRDILELGNNQRWLLRPGSLHDQIKQFGEMTVEPDVALSYHYTPGEITAETDCYLKSIVIDRTAQKFANKISNKVATVCHLIFGEKKCPSPLK